MESCFIRPNLIFYNEDNSKNSKDMILGWITERTKFISQKILLKITNIKLNYKNKESLLINKSGSSNKKVLQL